MNDSQSMTLLPLSGEETPVESSDRFESAVSRFHRLVQVSLNLVDMLEGKEIYGEKKDKLGGSTSNRLKSTQKGVETVDSKLETGRKEEGIDQCCSGVKLGCHMVLPLRNLCDHVRKRTQAQTTLDISYNLDDLEVDELLGRGAHGSVYKGRVSGKTVAVKRVNEIYKVSPWSAGVVMPELEVKDEIDHPNLVQIHGVHVVDKDWGGDLKDSSSRSSLNLCSFYVGTYSHGKKGDSDNVKYFRRVIVMEYCDKGNLWDVVKRGELHRGGLSGDPDYKRIVWVAMEIALAMEHLHGRGIVHGDLTAENVLLSSARSKKEVLVKVGDYSHCRKLHPTGGGITTFTLGSIDHMAPETLRNGKLHKPTDVFSFGVTMFEMISGRRPFLDTTPSAVLVAIIEGIRPKIPSTCPPDLASLMNECWQPNWQRRPSFGAILSRLACAVT